MWPEERALRGRGAEMSDPEADQDPGQATRLGRFDRRHQVLRRLLTDPFERHELLGRERVDVTGIGKQARVDELTDSLFTEALDVHRAAAREVDDPLDALFRTFDVDTVAVGLTGQPHQRLKAGHKDMRLVQVVFVVETNRSKRHAWPC